MKNLDLNKFGVQEMNAGEMRQTEGGSLLSTIIEIVKIGVYFFI